MTDGGKSINNKRGAGAGTRGRARGRGGTKSYILVSNHVVLIVIK